MISWVCSRYQILWEDVTKNVQMEWIYLLVNIPKVISIASSTFKCLDCIRHKPHMYWLKKWPKVKADIPDSTPRAELIWDMRYQPCPFTNNGNITENLFWYQTGIFYNQLQALKHIICLQDTLLLKIRQCKKVTILHCSGIIDVHPNYSLYQGKGWRCQHSTDVSRFYMCIALRNNHYICGRYP